MPLRQGLLDPSRRSADFKCEIQYLCLKFAANVLFHKKKQQFERAKGKHMSKAFFVMSTGRCSTQYLAKSLKDLAPECIVEHEPIGSNYMPRKVFRNARAFHKVLGANVKIQRKFVQVENAVATGAR